MGIFGPIIHVSEDPLFFGRKIYACFLAKPEIFYCFVKGFFFYGLSYLDGPHIGRVNEDFGKSQDIESKMISNRPSPERNIPLATVECLVHADFA